MTPTSSSISPGAATSGRESPLRHLLLRGGTVPRRTNTYSEDFGSDLNAAGGYRTPLHGWSLRKLSQGSPDTLLRRSGGPVHALRHGSITGVSVSWGTLGRRLGAHRSARERRGDRRRRRGTGRRELRRGHLRQGRNPAGARRLGRARGFHRGGPGSQPHLSRRGGGAGIRGFRVPGSAAPAGMRLPGCDRVHGECRPGTAPSRSW